MNKKTILLLLLMLTAMLYADGMYVPPGQLPTNIIQFINSYFPNSTIVYAEMDRKSYEIGLDNGVEIEFLRNGDLKEIEGNATCSHVPVTNCIKKRPTVIIQKNILFYSSS